MPRRIFPAGRVTNTTGAPLRLTFHATSTTGRRESDLYLLDSSNNTAERIPNGVILSDAAGAYGAFAGPDDVGTLYLQIGADSGSRTAITSTDIVAGNSAYVPSVVMPAATGVAATDAANFVAALAKVPATGGVIQLLPTTATAYNFTSGVTIDRPLTLRGGGGSNGPLSSGVGNSATYVTRITSSSTTGNAITVTSDGCAFENFALVNSATPSAGSGITVTAGGAHTRYRGVTIGGFYRNWDIAVGHEWFMSDCVAYDYVKTGVRIRNTALPDGGDMGIVNCQFIGGPNNAAPQAGVEWCSGGGLRLSNCKFNTRSGTQTIGLFLHPDDGINTSVFTVTGNSMENITYALYCDDTGNSGTGNIAKLAVVGNEFKGATKSIVLTRGASGHFNTVNITGNLFTGGGINGGVQLSNIDTVDIAGNTYTASITTRLTLGSNVTNLFLGPGYAFTTAGRPAATVMRAGSTYYDTTLLRPFWSDGTSWYQGLAAITTGTATLSGGTVTVSDASITANSIILLESKTLGGTPGAVYVSAKSASTSFTITSTSGTDTSTIQYYIKTY